MVEYFLTFPWNKVDMYVFIASLFYFFTVVILYQGYNTQMKKYKHGSYYWDKVLWNPYITGIKCVTFTI